MRKPREETSIREDFEKIIGKKLLDVRENEYGIALLFDNPDRAFAIRCQIFTNFRFHIIDDHLTRLFRGLEEPK